MGLLPDSSCQCAPRRHDGLRTPSFTAFVGGHALLLDGDGFAGHHRHRWFDGHGLATFAIIAGLYPLGEPTSGLGRYAVAGLGA
jgi:hypothetical protein